MSTIYVRKVVLNELDRVMEIIAEARELLGKEGSHQWQDGQPTRACIEADIAKGYCYGIIVGSTIAGTACLWQENEPSYDVIREGDWQERHSPYAAIHRVAISHHYRGHHLGDYIFSTLISVAYDKGYRNLRIDTTDINVRMQRIIEKFGFTYRGIIHVIEEGDGKRNAYELNLP